MIKPEPLIVVRSVDDSADFYCKLLCAERGHEGSNYAQILLDGQMILQLHDGEGDQNHEPLGDLDKPLGNGVILWFETDDFDAVLARTDQFGIEPERAPYENVFAKQMELWLRDPDGYRVVIAGPSPYPRFPVQG